MHIVERIHLQGADILHDDLEITAPHVLTQPWKTTRIFTRRRERDLDIVEGVCIQGNYSERVNESGDAVFVPIRVSRAATWWRRLRCRQRHPCACADQASGADPMKRIPELAGTLAVVLGLASGIGSVSAHHSASMYDETLLTTINGTVKEVRWVNPHVSLLILGAAREGGETAEWLLETTSPGACCVWDGPATA